MSKSDRVSWVCTQLSIQAYVDFDNIVGFKKNTVVPLRFSPHLGNINSPPPHFLIVIPSPWCKNEGAAMLEKNKNNGTLYPIHHSGHTVIITELELQNWKGPCGSLSPSPVKKAKWRTELATINDKATGLSRGQEVAYQKQSSSPENNFLPSFLILQTSASRSNALLLINRMGETYTISHSVVLMERGKNNQLSLHLSRVQPGRFYFHFQGGKARGRERKKCRAFHSKVGSQAGTSHSSFALPS